MRNDRLLKLGQATVFAVASIIPFAFASCEKEVLDLTPAYSLSEVSAFETPERCALAVAGAYDRVQQGRYSESIGWARGYPFGAASIIQSEMRGEDFMMSQQFFLITFQGTYNATSANNVAMWECSFEAINRINVVLDGVEKAGQNGVLSTELSNQYMGEMYFLRAMTYHMLLTHFSAPYNMQSYNNGYGLPLCTSPITSKDEMAKALEAGRATVAETYTQILSDLDKAEQMLPESIAENKITRANKYAAIALKTRVYLHMRDWANVKTEAEKMLTGPYTLESDLSTVFTSYAANTESIFSVENSEQDNPTVNGALSNMFSPDNRYMCPMSPILYNSSYWLADDARRANLVKIHSDNVPYCYKYRSKTMEEYAPMLRLAEVYMNYAEACLRSGDKATALTYLNKVRDRSLADATAQTYTDADFATDSLMLVALLWERRIEFYGEGMRWGDIHRLTTDDICPTGGIPAKIEYKKVWNEVAAEAFVIGKDIDYDAWKLVDAYPYTDRRFLWPIPTSELNANATLKGQQNVGW